MSKQTMATFNINQSIKPVKFPLKLTRLKIAQLNHVAWH